MQRRESKCARTTDAAQTLCFHGERSSPEQPYKGRTTTHIGCKCQKSFRRANVSTLINEGAVAKFRILPWNGGQYRQSTGMLSLERLGASALDGWNSITLALSSDLGCGFRQGALHTLLQFGLALTNSAVLCPPFGIDVQESHHTAEAGFAPSIKGW